jgi:hypothetical protein
MLLNAKRAGEIDADEFAQAKADLRHLHEGAKLTLRAS